MTTLINVAVDVDLKHHIDIWYKLNPNVFNSKQEMYSIFFKDGFDMTALKEKTKTALKEKTSKETKTALKEKTSKETKTETEPEIEY